MKINKILILGGAGYIGSVLTEHFLDRNIKVKSFDNFIYKQNSCVLSYLNDKNYELVYGDISSLHDIDNAIKDVNNVIILAGLVGDPITKKYPKESLEINETYLLNILNHLNGKGIRKLVFISTCSNYGLIKHGDFADENYNLNPLSLYSKAKVKIENHIISMSGKTDYEPTILRFATAFGISPRMRFDLTVSEFIRQLALGKELVVYDTNTWRPYCHVKDFARIIEMVLKSPPKIVSNQIFNAGADINNYTKQMIIDGHYILIRK